MACLVVLDGTAGVWGCSASPSAFGSLVTWELIRRIAELSFQLAMYVNDLIQKALLIQLPDVEIAEMMNLQMCQKISIDYN